MVPPLFRCLVVEVVCRCVFRPSHCGNAGIGQEMTWDCEEIREKDGKSRRGPGSGLCAKGVECSGRLWIALRLRSSTLSAST